jgi:intraflagellar transport protein 46
MYKPEDYESLNVDKETKDLFEYITRFKPITLELETKLKAFIPEYIPAVGEVDAFLKIPKPDNTQETLGLMDLDEPKLN